MSGGRLISGSLLAVLVACASALALAGCACDTTSPPTPDGTATVTPTPARSVSSPEAPSPTTAPVAGSPSPSPPADGPSTAWVAVSVATLWVKPAQDRSVDAPSCAAPADPAAWVAAMTTDVKRWLVGRLETQALYGTPVRVLATCGDWTRSAVPSQPKPRSPWGYPGWVPTRQLTRDEPERGARVGLYAGDGRMIHAPRTGAAVSSASLYDEPYFSEFAGGRRYWR